jgi:hypothetical protein
MAFQLFPEGKKSLITKAVQLILCNIINNAYFECHIRKNVYFEENIRYIKSYRK